MRRAWRIFVATLREIFDEAAYARFLGREGHTSRASYAAFLRETRNESGAESEVLLALFNGIVIISALDKVQEHCLLDRGILP